MAESESVKFKTTSEKPSVQQGRALFINAPQSQINVHMPKLTDRIQNESTPRLQFENAKISRQRNDLSNGSKREYQSMTTKLVHSDTINVNEEIQLASTIEQVNPSLGDRRQTASIDSNPGDLPKDAYLQAADNPKVSLRINKHHRLGGPTNHVGEVSISQTSENFKKITGSQRHSLFAEAVNGITTQHPSESEFKLGYPEARHQHYPSEHQTQSGLFMANMRKTLQPITNRGVMDVGDTSQVSEAAETLLGNRSKE